MNYGTYRAIDKVFPLTPLRKIGIGLFITALSFVVIVWIQGQIDAGLKPSINWQLLAYVILTLGEAMVSITAGVFLHPGAKFDEEFGHGAVVPHCHLGEGFVALVNKWILGGGHKLSAYQSILPFSPG